MSNPLYFTNEAQNILAVARLQIRCTWLKFYLLKSSQKAKDKGENAFNLCYQNDKMANLGLK